MFKKFFPAAFRDDFSASIVVALVALPLSLGIALAAGAPVLAGVVAAVVGGILVGALAGAPLQVSGPSAGNMLVIAAIMGDFGFAATCAVLAMAGGLQLALGFSRVARFVLLVPGSVVQGMLTGIGILIALGQLQVLFGATPQPDALDNLMQLPHSVTAMNPAAFLLGLSTLAVLVGWPRLGHLSRAVPAALVAIVVPTILSALFHPTVDHVNVGEGLLNHIDWPSWNFGGRWGEVVLSVVSLALVMSIESLLNASATDLLHRGPRANLDRELVAQGVGNVASGLLGGMPVTGVIVRSSANILAGARTRASTILHGVWILIFVGFFASSISMIPMAALAALLIFVGLKLINPAQLREMRRTGDSLFPYFVTLTGVVFSGLISGIAMGLVAAVLRKKLRSRR